MAFDELIGGNISQAIAEQLGTTPELVTAVLVIIVIWELIWTGFGCWKSARRNSPIWFILMLVLNTVGILEILYIFVFSELGKPIKPSKTRRPKPAKRSRARKSRKR